MKIEKIELSEERHLLTSLIVSDEVCEAIMPIFEPLRLKSTFSRTVGLWIQEYYQKYKVAPKRDIQTVYNSKKAELRDETDEKAIHDFLAFLSKEYESWEQTNANFNIVQAKKYIKQLAIEALLEDAAGALQKKDTEQAEKFLSDYQKQAAAFANSTKPLFAKIGDLPLQPPDWLVHGLFEKKSLNILFGDPGVGKSFLALDIGASIAAGLPFHSHGTKQGAVLYICGEARGTIARRCNAWAAHNDVELSAIPFYIFNGTPQLLDEASLQPLAKALADIAEKENNIQLIIFDTWNRLQGGDENSTADAAKAIIALDNLREPFSAAALIVHHSGHSEKQRMRGASALNAAADNAFRVELVNGTIMLTATKTKDGQAPQPSAFRLVDEEFGDGLRSAVLEEVFNVQVGKKKTVPKAQKVVEAVLQKYATVAEQIAAVEAAGYNRRTFFRYRKEIENKKNFSIYGGIKNKEETNTSTYGEINNKENANATASATNPCAVTVTSDTPYRCVSQNVTRPTASLGERQNNEMSPNVTKMSLNKTVEYQPYNATTQNVTKMSLINDEQKIGKNIENLRCKQNVTKMSLTNDELPAEVEARMCKFHLSIMQRMKQNSRLAAAAGGA